MFFIVPRCNQFRGVNILMLLNVIVIGAIIIIGCTYIDMSIDKFYSWYNNDGLPTKEKFFICLELLITGICMMAFIFIILRHNLQGVDLVDWEDMQLKMLGLIISNSWIWYVSYQAYHVVTK